jgi:hypothetical protein
MEALRGNAVGHCLPVLIQNLANERGQRSPLVGERLGDELRRPAGEERGRQIQAIGAEGRHDDRRQPPAASYPLDVVQQVRAVLFVRAAAVGLGRNLQVQQDVGTSRSCLAGLFSSFGRRILMSGPCQGWSDARQR